MRCLTKPTRETRTLRVAGRIQEGHDAGNEPQSRVDLPHLPVVDCRRIGAQVGGGLLLEESKVLGAVCGDGRQVAGAE